MIIITGAAGKLGRGIAEQMAARVSLGGVGVSVRNPEDAAALESLGVRVRHGDFNNLESLRHAFAGATQVLIVSSNARATGGDPLAQHRNAIDAAKSVGAGRVVYTSHMAVSDSSAFPPMLDHHATEEMLRASGMAWTSLRHGFYGSSGLQFMGEAFTSGLIEAPTDGKVSWTAHADLAEAAAVLLMSEGRYDGPTPPLTGSEALDLEDLAAIASEVLGRTIERKTIKDEVMRSKLSARNVPAVAMDTILGFYSASRAGEFAVVDPALETLLRRPLTGMRDLVVEETAG